MFSEKEYTSSSPFAPAGVCSCDLHLTTFNLAVEIPKPVNDAPTLAVKGFVHNDEFYIRKRPVILTVS